MIQILINDFGHDIAVGLRGTSKTEIQQTYFSFFNWKGTNGELYCAAPTFYYFWTTAKKINTYLQNRMWNILCAENEDNIDKTKKELQPQIDVLVEEFRATFIKEKFPLERAK
mgnify:CR=1 FL=1